MVPGLAQIEGNQFLNGWFVFDQQNICSHITRFPVKYLWQG